jgi:hypothetical protein
MILHDVPSHGISLLCYRLCFVDTAHTGEIAAGVAGGLILFLAVVLLVLYRNWRYEQELDSLLWKVDYRDIQINEDQQLHNSTPLSTKITRVTSAGCLSRKDTLHKSTDF